MLEELAKVEGLTKPQARTVASLLKKFSPTNKDNLEKAVHLLYDFYIGGNVYGAEVLLRALMSLKFNGNFNQWTFIEPAYTLKYYLSEDSTEKELIQTMLWKEVRSKGYDDEKQAAFLMRMMNGDMYQSDKEELEKYGDTPKSEYFWRKLTLWEALYILALGAKGSISEVAIREDIQAHILRLRELYAMLNN